MAFSTTLDPVSQTTISHREKLLLDRASWKWYHLDYQIDQLAVCYDDYTRHVV